MPLNAISIHPIDEIELASGFGQYHSDTSRKVPRSLVSVSISNIEAMVDNPQCGVSKQQAQWLIPSSLMTRSIEKQKSDGQFWILWVDIDENPPPLLEVSYLLPKIIFGARYEIYTSRSAREDYQKSRILIFLEDPLTASEWQLCAEVFNDKLESHGLVVDRSSQSPNQLCYLPNRGEFYNSISKRRGHYFNALDIFSESIKEKEKAIQQAERLIERRVEEAKQKRLERISEGFQSPIDAFNKAYPVEEILLKACYEQRGNTFRHLNSESGSFSASVKNGRVHSLSTSDPLYSDGEGAHDAFSAFQVLFHGDDRNAALKDAGENWLKVGELSWNESKLYRDKTDSSKSINKISGIEVSPLDLLNQWAANGDSEKMKQKMLDDVYIMKDLAILGQWTVFYAATGTGKTLMTLWLLCEAIEGGQIDGNDVFYANCDDNFKGALVKLQIAEQVGFKMLIPDHNGFQSEQLAQTMSRLVEAEQANGKIIILDTLKKFTDMMDKKAATDFGKVARSFVGAGGSLICLAHTNKHKGDDGKSIYSGTNDIISDADCGYVIENLGVKDGFGSVVQTVQFENIKQRGDVCSTAAFSYEIEQGAGYKALLDSVCRLTDQDMEEAKKKAGQDEQRQKDQEFIGSILKFVREGQHTKTDLVKLVDDEVGGGRRKIKQVLNRWEGKSADGGLWYIEKQGRNASVYKLNIDV
ncbi:MAG: AAA family ATPase [Cellvibrionaceae bacterium]